MSVGELCTRKQNGPSPGLGLRPPFRAGHESRKASGDRESPIGAFSSHRTTGKIRRSFSHKFGMRRAKINAAGI
jgi:hypothetical protein